MMEILESTLRLSTPLILAAMGGCLCERAGVATICLEGVLIAGAWVSAVVAYYTHSPWFSLLPCVLIGALIMGVHGILSTVARTNHIISGLVVNLFLSGITPFLCKWLFGTPTTSPSLPIADRFSSIHLSGLSEWPFIGILVSQMPITYFAFASVIAIHLIIRHTRWGLRLTASGEDPQVLLSAGVRPNRIRLPAMLWGGALCSLGGAFLSISHASQFTRDMSSGRGYIALTALIFGNWRPIPTLLACLLFGLADAAQIHLQSAEILPIQFIQAIPYAMTLFVLVAFVGRGRAPAAIGRSE